MATSSPMNAHDCTHALLRSYDPPPSCSSLDYPVPHFARSHSLLPVTGQRGRSGRRTLLRLFRLAVTIEAAEVPENGVPIHSPGS